MAVDLFKSDFYHAAMLNNSKIKMGLISMT